MTTALATRQLTPDVWSMIQSIAPTMKDSRIFGIRTVQEAQAIMLKGHELGLSLTASLEFIQVVQDKPTLSPRGALALIIDSGQAEQIEIKDVRNDKGEPHACEVTMKRRGGVMKYTTSFSMDDAKRAGLVKPGSGWASYPANMMKWRAVGFCADVVFPDITGGMKRADELGANISPNGDVIETTWTQTSNPAPVTQVTSTPAPLAVDINAKLNELIQNYTAEKVLVAGEGKIPSTLAEIEAIEEKLLHQLDNAVVAEMEKQP